MVRNQRKEYAKTGLVGLPSGVNWVRSFLPGEDLKPIRRRDGGREREIRSGHGRHKNIFSIQYLPVSFHRIWALRRRRIATISVGQLSFFFFSFLSLISLYDWPRCRELWPPAKKIG
ncbi:T23J18.6 [Arabidopsis thaliana]|uniref:T23J18.6 n=1 Tax=Arabidopsis thaliana TaxID=3702 RepID=Q9LPZ5_ARATH|nr:T23J18.6 [Arabidopsis thaliana]